MMSQQLYPVDNYVRALDTIAQSDHVILYCGAGVTISSTGLSWQGMVSAVAERLTDLKDFKILDEENFSSLKEYIRNPQIEPMRKASLLSELIREIEASESNSLKYKEILRRALTASLYSKYKRQAAPFSSNTQLLDHISLLAFYLLLCGKRVSIITTNYDTFLEGHLRMMLAVLTQWGFTFGLKVYSNGEPVTSANEARQVSFHYLHGRVPRNSDSKNTNLNGTKVKNGEVVFSEEDYFKHQNKTRKRIGRIMGDDGVIVIIGSSLEDPPLLQWLHSNKASKKLATVWVTTISKEKIDAPHILDKNRRNKISFLSKRLKHIGIDYYIPFRCYGEVPEFFRDVILRLGVRRTVRSKSRSIDISTQLQLSDWSKKVEERINTRKITYRLYRTLHSGNEQIQKIANSFIGQFYPVSTKVELWLRGLAPGLGDPSQFVKVADSSGVVLDPRSRRIEHLSRRFPSRSASVRAFQDAQAELLTLKDLGLQTNSSRWQAFYAIPIQDDLGLDANAAPQVTVGVIGLAFKIDDSCGAKPKGEKDRDAFAQIVHEKAFDLGLNYGPEKKLRDALLVVSRKTLELLHD